MIFARIARTLNGIRLNRTKLQPLTVTLIDRIGRIEVLLPISHLIFVLLDINCDVIIIRNNRKWLVPNNVGVRNIILLNNCNFNREQINFSKSMPTCFSIVQKYGHLQKYSLRNRRGISGRRSSPSGFSRRVKVETRAGKTGSALAD